MSLISKGSFLRKNLNRSPRIEKPIDGIEEVQENKEGEEDGETKEIEEIEYVSEKSLEEGQEEEEDVERDALTVATTALDSTYNETVD